MSLITLLDGATGTELSRRGYDTRLPLWSARPLAEHPTALTAIHRDYLRAGATVLTACTFRTHRRSLAHAGWQDRADELNLAAVAAARDAISAEGAESISIAGSIAPLEDCFRVDLVPHLSALREEHEQQARSLAVAGVDRLLVETMGCRREAEAATAAALDTGLPVWASLLGRGDGRLYSGEPLADTVAALEALGAEAILVNCGPAVEIRRDVDVLRASTSLPIGAYSNIGHAHDVDGWRVDLMLTPTDFADQMTALVSCGATILGGCCGTQPAHIAELALRLTRRPQPSIL